MSGVVVHDVVVDRRDRRQEPAGEVHPRRVEVAHADPSAVGSIAPARNVVLGAKKYSPPRIVTRFAMVKELVPVLGQVCGSGAVFCPMTASGPTSGVTKSFESEPPCWIPNWSM